MALDSSDTGVIAIVVSAASLVWGILTGRRREQRETEDQRRARDEARKAEIHVEAIRAVEDSGKFVLAASQIEVNARLLADVADTKKTVGGVSEKLDRILFSGGLDRRRDD